MTPRPQIAFIALFLLLFVSSGAAQGKSGIKGRVTYKFDRMPIPNAFVLIPINGGTDIHVRTDAKGRYTVELSPGVYDVFFSASGFAPMCRKIEIQPNEMVNLDPVLEASSVGMQETKQQ